MEQLSQETVELFAQLPESASLWQEMVSAGRYLDASQAAAEERTAEIGEKRVVPQPTSSKTTATKKKLAPKTKRVLQTKKTKQAKKTKTDPLLQKKDVVIKWHLEHPRERTSCSPLMEELGETYRWVCRVWRAYRAEHPHAVEHVAASPQKKRQKLLPRAIASTDSEASSQGSLSSESSIDSQSSVGSLFSLNSQSSSVDDMPLSQRSSQGSLRLDRALDLDNVGADAHSPSYATLPKDQRPRRHAAVKNLPSKRVSTRR